MEEQSTRDKVITLEATQKSCIKVREKEYKEVTKRLDKIDSKMWAMIFMWLTSLIAILAQTALALFNK